MNNYNLSTLRNLIKEIYMANQDQIRRGAGIIVVRNFHGTYKVLALTTHKGILDIPKGAIEDDEFPLEAALRETIEECGISKLDFKWGVNYFENGDLTCYVAETIEDPVISRNPETGVMEHTMAAWVSWDEIMQGTFEYIVPCIEWAKRNVEAI
jgi:bis(5'-nucleosidyl)-tetraphosphatase